MEVSFRSSRDVILRTARWSEASTFYRLVLGFTVVHQSENLVGVETGAFRLYVEQGPPHGPVFDFLVPDVQAAKIRLLAAGCTVQEEDSSVPRCYIRDPYGLVFNVAQSPGAE
jgi:catechol 2,3-dioxygenase-like lactoylglutathione lyase family enzyme